VSLADEADYHDAEVKIWTSNYTGVDMRFSFINQTTRQVQVETRRDYQFNVSVSELFATAFNAVFGSEHNFYDTDLQRNNSVRVVGVGLGAQVATHGLTLALRQQQRNHWVNRIALERLEWIDPQITTLPYVESIAGGAGLFIYDAWNSNRHWGGALAVTEIENVLQYGYIYAFLLTELGWLNETVAPRLIHTWYQTDMALLPPEGLQLSSWPWQTSAYPETGYPTWTASLLRFVNVTTVVIWRLDYVYVVSTSYGISYQIPSPPPSGITNPDWVIRARADHVLQRYLLSLYSGSPTPDVIPCAATATPTLIARYATKQLPAQYAQITNAAAYTFAMSDDSYDLGSI